MKMKKEHFEYLKGIYDATGQQIIKDHLDFIIHEGKSKNPLERLRWDFINSRVGSKYTCSVLYPYLKDNHIDTALRKIFNHK